MQELIDQLNEPDKHFPGNFDTPKQANALLMCLCQEAAGVIKSQAAEIAELREMAENIGNLHSVTLDEYSKLKTLCDQMGEALHFSYQELKGWYEGSCGEYYNSPKINEALEAWRAMKWP